MEPVCPRRAPRPRPARRGDLQSARRVLLVLVLAWATAAAALVVPAPVALARDWLHNPNDDPALGDATPFEDAGQSVALDVGRVAVGAAHASTDFNAWTGIVRVYERSSGGWSLASRVDPSGAEGLSGFGTAVALNGPTLAVGAPGSLRSSFPAVGSVYIYNDPGSGFAHQQTLTPPGLLDQRRYGIAIALDADTLAVGARQGARGTIPDAGVVNLYQRANGTWQLRQTLVAAVPRPNDGFGSALVLEGDLLLIGAPAETDRGSAYAYARDGESWVLQQRFEAPAGSTASDFGFALTTDGQRVLVGAPSLQQNAAGAVFEFRRNGTGWVAGRVLVASGQPDLHRFGLRLAQHGGRWVVGAVRGAIGLVPEQLAMSSYIESGGELVSERQFAVAYRHGGGLGLSALALDAESIVAGLPTSRFAPWSDSGEARVIPLHSGASEFSLNPGGTAGGEAFGSALAATSLWLAVGVPNERRRSALSGSVYLFPRAGAEPITSAPAVLTLPGLLERDALGSALAFSGDTLLTGAPMRYGGGSVHAFEHDGSAWQPIASWRVGLGEANRFGECIDADAKAFVASAPGETGGGAVHVVERNAGGWLPPERLVAGDGPPTVFGVDVDLDGSSLAVSTQRIEGNGTGQQLVFDGEVFVFNRFAFGWGQTARVVRPESTTPNARFGAAVALSGDLLAVGGPLAGEVHVYRLDAGAWTWTHRIDGVASSFGGFGSRLRFVDGDLWIAAPALNALYRYHFAGDRWRLMQTLASGSTNLNDGLGRDFAVDEGRVFAGVARLDGQTPRALGAGAVFSDELVMLGDGFED